jgi:hypothetical protein
MWVSFHSHGDGCFLVSTVKMGTYYSKVNSRLMHSMLEMPFVPFFESGRQGNWEVPLRVGILWCSSKASRGSTWIG